MTRRPPAERTLPGKREMLERILADDPQLRTPKRRPVWVVPAIAAAAVAGIVGAALIGPQAIRSSEPAPPAEKSQETEIDLDLGPLAQKEIQNIRRLCLFNGTVKQVVHATKIRTAWNDRVEWTIALKGHDLGGNGIPPGDNRLMACSGKPNNKSPDGPISEQGVRLHDFWTTVGPAPTAEELAKLPKGESFFIPKYDDSFRPIEGFPLEAHPGKKWATPLWVKVPTVVDRVRQRLLVDGKPGPWFSSRVVDGLSFTQGWIDAPLSRSSKYELEVQFLDESGQPVEIPGSTGPTTVLDSSGMQFNKTYKMSDYLVS